MHAKTVRINRTALISIISAVFVLCVSIVATSMLYQSHINHLESSKTAAEQPEKVITLPPPAVVPSAEVVARSLHCKKFLNIGVGGGVQGIVLDEGSCYIGTVKYAIDTFQTSQIRDTWLKMAKPMGVVPAFETATSVTYKSVTG
jgi:hypothetical protein